MAFEDQTSPFKLPPTHVNPTLPILSIDYMKYAFSHTILCYDIFLHMHVLTVPSKRQTSFTLVCDTTKITTKSISSENVAPGHKQFNHFKNWSSKTLKSLPSRLSSKLFTHSAIQRLQMLSPKKLKSQKIVRQLIQERFNASYH